MKPISRSRLLRMATAGALALVALFALQALVGNLLLSNHTVARLVSANPDALRIDYANARTLWPGRVHVEGLEVRGRDARVEWALHVDAADADISLLRLLGHRFAVAKVDAVGITFRIRFRLEPGEANTDRVSRLPAIDGFAPVPLVGVPPEKVDAHAARWTIDIQGIEARAIRELWIDTYRLTGLVDAQGGLTIGSDRLVVAPGTADVQGAALTTGDDPIVTDVQGTVDAQVEPVDLANVTGAAVLRYLTMRSTLQGKMGGLHFIQRFLGGAGITLDGGTGTFRSEARVVRGKVNEGTSSRLELERASVDIGGYRIDGRTRIGLTTMADTTTGAIGSELGVTVADVTFTAPAAKGPAIRCPELTASAHVSQVDVSDAFSAVGDLAWSWKSPRIEILDLRPLDALLGKDAPFRIERGTATLGTEGHGTLEGASGETRIESTLTMMIDGGRVSSSIAGTVPMTSSFGGGTIDLSHANLTLRDPAVPGWWGAIKLGSSVIHVSPPSAALSLSMTARDARPFLSLYAAMQKTSPIAATAMRLVPDPMIESMTANLIGSARITASPNAVEVHALDVHGASSRLRGTITKHGERIDGGVLVEAGPTSLGVSFAGGKTGLVLLGAPQWFESSVERGAH